MNRKLGAVIIAVAVAVGIYFMTAEKKIEQTACGKVTIAEMNWASAELMANVDKIILEKGYDCEVELVAGATMPTFTSMNEKGMPDIAPELWSNAVQGPLSKAKDEKRLFVANPGPITGLGEGWWVSPSVVKNHPEIKTVLDIIERPDLFPHPEDSSKGGMMTCPAGWNCQLSTNNLFRAFKMEEKGWKLIDPGSAAGLDGAIAKASTRNENWFGYYWTPTSVVGKYGLVKIPFGVDYDDDNWHNCIVKPEKECANPKPTSWTKSVVETVVTNNFMNNSGIASDFIKNRTYPGEIMNKMLVFMTDQKATGKDAAFEFLQKHEDVWKKWVSDDAATKIKASL